MAQQAESRLQRAIRQRLKNDVGGYWFKIWVGPFQQAGLPDVVGCVEGLFFGFEVKTTTGKTSKLQDKTLQRMRDAGGVAAVIRTPDQAVKIVRAALNDRARQARPTADRKSSTDSTDRQRRVVRRTGHRQDMDSRGRG